MAQAKKKENPWNKPTSGSNGKQEITDVPDIRGFQIPRPQIRQATLELQGISPLLMHKWSDKALGMLEGAQTGKAKGQRAARQPEQEARDAAYVNPGCEDWEDG